VAELLMRVTPLIQQRNTLEEDFRRRGLVLPQNVQESLESLRVHAEDIRALAKRAEGSWNFGELESIESQLMTIMKTIEGAAE
jgi:hypothetical protein